MAVAMVHREAYSKGSKLLPFRKSDLYKARLILNHSETKAREVMAGSELLDVTGWQTDILGGFAVDLNQSDADKYRLFSVQMVSTCLVG